MIQPENQVVLHMDTRMFAKEYFYQAETDIVISIMTYISLKSVLEEWIDKDHSVAKIEMKQLHFKNKFIPMNPHDLTNKE